MSERKGGNIKIFRFSKNIYWSLILLNKFNKLECEEVVDDKSRFSFILTFGFFSLYVCKWRRHGKKTLA